MFKKIFLIISVIIFGSLSGFSFFVIDSLIKPYNSEEKFFEVKYGQRTVEIAQRLFQEGLISSPFIFTWYLRAKLYKIQSGVYKIGKGRTIPEIAKLMKEGKVAEHLITIPEGWRTTQIDQLLSEKKILPASAFLSIAQSKEGYLFPDTYRLSTNSTAEEIRDKMIANFNQRTEGLKITRKEVILASIVEREAKYDWDRPKIARVFLNRLERGLKLEADPTIQYAKGSWDPISKEDYKSIISPYNTYLHPGLPPGPISNPGLKSLQAVLNPEKNDFLYFFHLKDGMTIYSKTEEEHNQNKIKYGLTK